MDENVTPDISPYPLFQNLLTFLSNHTHRVYPQKYRF